MYSRHNDHGFNREEYVAIIHVLGRYSSKPATLAMFGGGYGSYGGEPKTERNTMNMRQELALLEIRFENRKLLERIAASEASNGYEAKISEAKACAFQIAQDDVNELIARVEE